MASCTSVVFVTGSLCLTGSILAVGISFFAPYWLSNIPSVDESRYANPAYVPYLDSNVTDYPDRGLWAQCGATCQWFWENNYQLQTHMLTPLKWHLATQVLYFIGAVVLLTSEIFARVQLCCDERTSVYWSLSILIMASALIQTAAIATFGGGAARQPYWVVSDPVITTPLLGQADQSQLSNGSKPYLGWCFWMAVTGDIMTVVAGAMFIITACCCARYSRTY